MKQKTKKELEREVKRLKSKLNRLTTKKPKKSLIRIMVENNRKFKNNTKRKNKNFVTVDNQHYPKCKNCHGKGCYMEDNLVGTYEETDCPICDGHGYIKNRDDDDEN